jgi:hypothetical protein
VENRSVSASNVDLVRSSMEALVRGDFDEAFAAYDSAAAWHTAARPNRNDPAGGGAVS